MPTHAGHAIVSGCCSLISERHRCHAPRRGFPSPPELSTITSRHPPSPTPDRVCPEPLEKVFGSFGAAKPPGREPGWGTAINKGVHRGRARNHRRTNDPNGGAVFGVLLPLSALESRRQRDPMTARSPPPTTFPRNRTDGKSHRLLPPPPPESSFVGDDRIILESLGELLRLEGFHVQSGPSLPRRRQALDRDSFELILPTSPARRKRVPSSCKCVRRRSPETVMVMITDCRGIEDARRSHPPRRLRLPR